MDQKIKIAPTQICFAQFDQFQVYLLITLTFSSTVIDIISEISRPLVFLWQDSEQRCDEVPEQREEKKH